MLDTNGMLSEHAIFNKLSDESPRRNRRRLFTCVPTFNVESLGDGQIQNAKYISEKYVSLPSGAGSVPRIISGWTMKVVMLLISSSGDWQQTKPSRVHRI